MRHFACPSTRVCCARYCSLHLMNKRKAPLRDIRSYLEKNIYPLCPWNLFVRQCLVEIGDEDGKNCRLRTDEFLWQTQQLLKIQSLFRGFQLRNHWHSIAQHAWIAKKGHLSKMKIAKTAFIQQMMKIKRKLCLQWRENARDLKIMKQSSSLMIQYSLRGHWVREYYKRQLTKVERANFTYYIACQNAYNHTRLRILLGWRKFSYQTRNTQCADTLNKSIISNGVAVVMVCRIFLQEALLGKSSLGVLLDSPIRWKSL